MKLVHLSDLHFGNKASRRKERSLAQDILAHNPDLLVITGDVTDRGSVSQFKQAVTFLDSLKIPYVCVPGNREINVFAVWEWMIPRLAMRRYSIYFGDKDRVVYRSDEHRVVLFGLNSVHSFPSWPGKIHRATRYWLRERAAEFPGYFKVLFLHHPVLPVIRSSSYWAHALSDAGDLLNIAIEHEIRLILQGHKHRAAAMEVRYPEKNARIVVSSGGAPLMPYWDSTYHVIEITQSSIVVRPREFDSTGFVGDASYHFSLQ